MVSAKSIAGIIGWSLLLVIALRHVYRKARRKWDQARKEYRRVTNDIKESTCTSWNKKKLNNHNKPQIHAFNNGLKTSRPVRRYRPQGCRSVWGQGPVRNMNQGPAMTMNIPGQPLGRQNQVRRARPTQGTWGRWSPAGRRQAPMPRTRSPSVDLPLGPLFQHLGKRHEPPGAQPGKPLRHVILACPILSKGTATSCCLEGKCEHGDDRMECCLATFREQFRSMTGPNGCCLEGKCVHDLQEDREKECCLSAFREQLRADAVAKVNKHLSGSHAQEEKEGKPGPSEADGTSRSPQTEEKELMNPSPRRTPQRNHHEDGWEVGSHLTRQASNYASSEDDFITIKAEAPIRTWTSNQRTVDHQREIRK